MYRKLFGLHKWESVKYCIYVLNRLDLHSIIRLCRMSFYRRIMLSVGPLLRNTFFGSFLIDSQHNSDGLSVFRSYSDAVFSVRHVLQLMSVSVVAFSCVNVIFLKFVFNFFTSLIDAILRVLPTGVLNCSELSYSNIHS